VTTAPLQNDVVATEAFRRLRDHLLAHRDDLDAARDWRARAEDFRFFNWAFDWFDPVAACRSGTALVVIDDSGCSEVGYPELALASSRMAARLQALGVGPGDRVVLFLDNSIALWEVLIAGIRLGAVLVPCSTAIGTAGLADRVRRSRAAAVICDVVHSAQLDAILGTERRSLVRLALPRGPDLPIPKGWANLRESQGAEAVYRRAHRTRGDDELLVYFTSGTTSRPKMVAHTHMSYPVGHLSGMYWNGLRPGDRHLNLSAAGWAKHAWSSLFAPFAAEATVVSLTATAPTAGEVLRTLAEQRIDSFCAPPTVWRRLVGEDLDAHDVALREATSAGEPLSPEIADRVHRAWGVAIREGYGQTETTAQIGVSPGATVPTGSMGKALPGYAVALLDPETGQPGLTGEIAIWTEPRPIGLAAAYLDDAGRGTALEQAGWYRTGDLAEMDADGSFFYLGRVDDVFKCAGHRVSPFEVESALLAHPFVAEAAVVAFPDDQLTAVPKAFIQLVAGVSGDEASATAISRHAAGLLGSHATPRRIEFCELPTTASGKIRRAELRRRDAARAGTGDAAGEFVVSSGPGNGTITL
jgi:acetyl-CoA synthetase